MIARPRSGGARNDAGSALAPVIQYSMRHVARAVNQFPIYSAERGEVFRILFPFKARDPLH